MGQTRRRTRMEAKKVARLRNGSEELFVGVAAHTMSLRALNPIILYELVMFARDSNHQIFGDCGQELVSFNLLSVDNDGNYRIHDSTRNIVLSSVEGEGFDMVMVNPVVGIKEES